MIANRGSRLTNYIIDTISFMFILILHAFVLDGWLHLIPEDGSSFLALYFFILYFGYHFLFEYFWGRTPGKFFTNTIVVDISGTKPTLKALFIRNLSRLIPLDPFSFIINTGWHDSFSQTNVINRTV
jgi:uncharacterized RDD family membrane protein YckC